jgi:hypothetical protein
LEIPCDSGKNGSILRIRALLGNNGTSTASAFLALPLNQPIMPLATI